MWSDVGLFGSSVCALLCFLLSVRIVAQPNNWIKGSVFMLATGTLVYFLGLLMPPFTFLFKSGFKVHGGANSTDNTSVINSDPQIQQTLDNAIGTGFSTVAFTWYAILFAFLVEGIPVGFFLASLLFRHQRGGEANSVLSIHRGRIQVIMWLAHLMAPMTQLLASIILYQVAGTSNEFAICWVFLWFLPLFGVAYVGKEAGGKRRQGSLLSASSGSVNSGSINDPATADTQYKGSSWRTTSSFGGVLPATKAKKLSPAVIAGLYLIVVGSLLTRILVDLLTIFPSAAEVLFLALVATTSTLVIMLTAYVSLNIEYQGDKLILANVTNGTGLVQVVDTSGSTARAVEITDGTAAAASAAAATSSNEYDDSMNRAGNDEAGSTGGIYEDADDVPLVTDAFVPKQRQWPKKLNYSNTAVANGDASPFKVAAGALWAYMSEAREQSNPALYGKRLPYRRIMLLISVVCLGVFTLKKFHEDERQSALDEIKQMLKDIDPDLVWPANGTVFDNVFEIYGQYRYKADCLSVVAWVVLLLTVLVEPFMKVSVGLKASQIGCALAMFIMWLQMVLPAAPNYLKALHYNEIIAFCAPEFNTFVHHLIANTVGLACSAFFAATLLLMLVVICPALVRVSRLMFIDKKLSAWEETASTLELVVYRKNLLITMAWSSLLAPLLCCLPMLIFFQFFGDVVVGVMFAFFTLLPIVAAFFASKQYVTHAYATYLLFYFVPLFIVVGYEAHKHGLAEQIAKILRDPYTYVEFGAEIFLANVVVSDIMYATMT